MGNLCSACFNNFIEKDDDTQQILIDDNDDNVDNNEQARVFLKYNPYLPE